MANEKGIPRWLIGCVTLLFMSVGTFCAFYFLPHHDDSQIPFQRKEWLAARTQEERTRVRLRMKDSVLHVLDGLKTRDEVTALLGAPDSVASGDQLPELLTRIGDTAAGREDVAFVFDMGVTVPLPEYTQWKQLLVVVFDNEGNVVDLGCYEI